MSDPNNKLGIHFFFFPVIGLCQNFRDVLFKKPDILNKYEPFVNHEPMHDEATYFNNIQKWFLLDIFDKRLKKNTNTNYFFLHDMTSIPGVKNVSGCIGLVQLFRVQSIFELGTYSFMHTPFLDNENILPAYFVQLDYCLLREACWGCLVQSSSTPSLSSLSPFLP